MLILVELPGIGRRFPSQLSGGQQQRVALARALINEPTVLLLDEPLGALDLKVRRRMQQELKRIHREVGVTFIYVTHDQEEALTMSDRLAVMNGGKIEQVGAPQDVYEDPETLFVADFLGVSNLMDATAHGARDGRCRVRADTFELAAGSGAIDLTGPAKIVIRPERVELASREAASGPNRLPGMVERLVYVGSAVQVIVRVATGEVLQVLVPNRGKALPYEQGTPVQLYLPVDAVRVLAAPEESEAEPVEPQAVTDASGHG
jgi:spermidine/putrescine transport system ATP-binding protein